MLGRGRLVAICGSGGLWALPMMNSMESQNHAQAMFWVWEPSVATLPVWMVPRMMVTATVINVREKMAPRISFFLMVRRTFHRMTMGRQRTRNR